MVHTRARENTIIWDKRVHLLTMVYRSTPHEPTGFSPNFRVFEEMEHPDNLSIQDELECIHCLRDRLEDAYDVA